jgi:hypothetical protein
MELVLLSGSYLSPLYILNELNDVVVYVFKYVYEDRNEICAHAFHRMICCAPGY